MKKQKKMKMRKKNKMNYYYGFILLFGIGNQLQGADAQRPIKPLFGLLKEVRDTTHLPRELCQEVGRYVGTYQLWEKELRSNEESFVRSLSPEELVVIEKNGRVTIFDKISGEHLRSLSFIPKRPPLRITRAEVLRNRRIILACDNGKFRVIDCHERAPFSVFEICSGHEYVNEMQAIPPEGWTTDVPGGVAAVRGMGWNITNNNYVQEFSMDDDVIQNLKYLEDDNLLVATTRSVLVSGGKAKVVAWHHMASHTET